MWTLAFAWALYELYGLLWDFVSILVTGRDGDETLSHFERTIGALLILAWLHRPCRKRMGTRTGYGLAATAEKPDDYGGRDLRRDGSLRNHRIVVLAFADVRKRGLGANRTDITYRRDAKERRCRICFCICPRRRWNNVGSGSGHLRPVLVWDGAKAKGRHSIFVSIVIFITLVVMLLTCSILLGSMAGYGLAGVSGYETGLFAGRIVGVVAAFYFAWGGSSRPAPAARCRWIASIPASRKRWSIGF